MRYPAYVQARFGADELRERRRVYLAGTLAVVTTFGFHWAVNVGKPGTALFAGLAGSCALLSLVGFLGASAALMRWSGIIASAVHRRVLHEREVLRGRGRRFEPGDGVWQACTDAERDQGRDWLTAELGVADFEQAAEVVGEPVLYGHACALCGAPSAPVLCPKCRVPQVHRLQRARAQFPFPPLRLSIALFVAQYRFDLMQVASLPLLVSVVAGGVGALVRHADAVHADATSFDARTDEIVTAMLDWRSALALLELECGGDPRHEGCAAWSERFHDGYRVYSWFAAPVLDELGVQKCGPSLDLLDEGPAREAACAALARMPKVQALDAVYNRYLAATFVQGADPVERRRTARELYSGGRYVGCVLALASLERPGASIAHAPCDELVSAPFVPDEIGPCPLDAWGCRP